MSLSDLQIRREDLNLAIWKREREKQGTFWLGAVVLAAINVLPGSTSSGDRLIASIALMGFALPIREVVEVQARILGQQLMQTMDAIDAHPGDPS